MRKTTTPFRVSLTALSIPISACGSVNILSREDIVGQESELGHAKGIEEQGDNFGYHGPVQSRLVARRAGEFVGCVCLVEGNVSTRVHKSDADRAASLPPRTLDAVRAAPASPS